MLPKSYRLPHSIRLVRSKTFNHPLFLLKYTTSTNETPRFGVVISKKIDKRAVKRNRMRRLLHTFIQDNLSLFPPGYDYLFIVTRLFEEQPANLAETLSTHFSNQ